MLINPAITSQREGVMTTPNLVFASHNNDSNVRVAIQEHKEVQVEFVEDTRRACRVVIENVVDFHHEVLESVVLRFPLPWHTFNCSINKPIIYDFALYQNRFHLHIAHASKGSGAHGAKFLNETEFFRWKMYFKKNLQYKVFERSEGKNSLVHANGNGTNVNVKTRAYFNNLIGYNETVGNDAWIDATCDISGGWAEKMQGSPNKYCLLHGKGKANPDILKRSCFLSPMWPESQCTILASDLPKIDNWQEKRKSHKDTTVCVIGSNRNHTFATELFSKIPFVEKNAKLVIFSRHGADLQPIFDSFGISNQYASVIHELDYELYHENISACDIALPLTDPLSRPHHFPWSLRKSSGIVPVLAAYEIASVTHVDFAKIYQHQLTAPYEVYNNSSESHAEALNRMLEIVIDNKSSSVEKD